MRHECTCGGNSGHTSIRECEANRQATRRMQQLATASHQALHTKAMINREKIAKAKIIETGRVQIGDDQDWDIVIGTQFEKTAIALRSRRYRDGHDGAVLFLSRGDARYSEFYAVAISADSAD